MDPVVLAPNAIARQVGIDLRRRDAGMTEQFLDAANVRPTIE